MDKTFQRVFEKKTFENYNLNFNKHETEIDQVKKFLNIENKNRILILFGKAGRGKTHIAIASKKYCVFDIGVQVKFISSTELYKLFLRLQSIDRDIDAEDLVYGIYLLDLLIIDDLGSEKQTEKNVFNEGFKSLLDKFEGKFLITTNLSLSDILEVYGEKIYSRLHAESEFITLNGKDYRIEKK